MILIGERINTSFSEVENAFENKDPKVINEVARKQVDAGADYLDINLGAASKDPDDMVWLVEAVQEEVDAGLCIDAQKSEIVEPALKACKGDALINSTTAEEEKMEDLIPLAADYGASIIGVTSGEDGAPQDVAGRLQLASTIFNRADSAGLEPDDLFIDPVAMPLKFMQEQSSNLLEAISQLKTFPTLDRTCLWG